MPARAPNFSPYPVAQLRSLSRAEAALETAVARWLRLRPLGDRVAALAGGAVRARIVGVAADRAFDPHAAHAEVRIGGAGIVIACAARPIRALAQRLLGGPDELAAPRPLTAVEDALWVLVVAAAIEDTGAPAEAWACAGPPAGAATAIELCIEPADPDDPRAPAPWTAIAYVPRALEVRVPPPRPLPHWTFDLPIVVGRCRLAREDLARLAVRDVVTIERELSLVVGEAAIALTAAPQAVEARVATGYVPPAMSPALADAAPVELTVQLGTTRLTLRELGELVPGAVVPLGRPLAGPFEIRAAGRLIGRGELVDVDGELGVRIVSLEE